MKTAVLLCISYLANIFCVICESTCRNTIISPTLRVLMFFKKRKKISIDFNADIYVCGLNIKNSKLKLFSDHWTLRTNRGESLSVGGANLRT